MQNMEEPNWSNIPRDILETISLKIISITDYVRFRAVCTTWCSVLPRLPQNLLQLPWLIFPQNPENEGNYDSTLSFFNLLNSTVRTINLPETRGNELSPSSQGWLTLQNGPKISLFNPITRAKIHLPSLKNSPNLLFKPLLPSYIRCKLGIVPFWHNFKNCTDPIVQKTTLISNNCVVMALLKNNWGLAICKIGDESWSLLDEPPIHDDYKVFDATYCNELFHTISRKEVRIYNIDGSRKDVIKIELPLYLAKYYLLDGALDLLLVAEKITGGFYIYKLRKEGKPTWIEVNNIGEKMIFISNNHQCISLQVNNSKLNGCKGNMLCYASPFVLTRHKNRVEFEYNINLINLTSQEVTRVASSLGPYNAGCMQTLWLTPSLDKFIFS